VPQAILARGYGTKLRRRRIWAVICRNGPAATWSGASARLFTSRGTGGRSAAAMRARSLCGLLDVVNAVGTKIVDPRVKPRTWEAWERRAA